jgi:hypothetical protein
VSSGRDAFIVDPVEGGTVLEVSAFDVVFTEVLDVFVRWDAPAQYPTVDTESSSVRRHAIGMGTPVGNWKENLKKYDLLLIIHFLICFKNRSF